MTAGELIKALEEYEPNLPAIAVLDDLGDRWPYPIPMDIRRKMYTDRTGLDRFGDYNEDEF